MAETSAVLPFRTLSGNGGSFDWYMVPFDKQGNCTGPSTREHIVERAGDPAVTDIFIFSHGWNNDWNVATDRYSEFIAGYLGMRHDRQLPIDREFNPLLVGIFWPSTVLAFGKERGLEIAAGGEGESAAIVQERKARNAEVAALAEGISPADLPRFYELVDAGKLADDEARELVGMLSPVIDLPEDDYVASRQPYSAAAPLDSVVKVWHELELAAPNAEPEDAQAIAAEFKRVGLATGSAAVGAAGLLNGIDPRNVVRATTVLLMKDRAGVVGAKGVGALLVDLLNASRVQQARVHLVGHSYGAKVCLSATCCPPKLPRPVTSMLLLQPAVSHRCFADDEEGRGGYADAPDRVDLPILATYSRHDIPLRYLFEFAVRRRDDRDELRTAGEDKPSRYAALGGYGPRGLGDGSKLIGVLTPGYEPARNRYDLGAAAPGVYGIDATSTIGGHGDISNLSTWWALYNLVSADLPEEG